MLFSNLVVILAFVFCSSLLLLFFLVAAAWFLFTFLDGDGVLAGLQCRAVMVVCLIGESAS